MKPGQCRFFAVLTKRWTSNRWKIRRQPRKKNRIGPMMAMGAAALFGPRLVRAQDNVPAVSSGTTGIVPSSAPVIVPAIPTTAVGSDASTALPEIVVSGERGYKRNQIVSPKYTAPLVDTPQSATVVPQQVMEDQGATTLRDTLRNVAGISLAAGEGGSQGDNLTIRGFSARSDIFMDGMRDFGSYYRDPFDQEAVEVLKGPASVNFGRGSTGGVVNQVTKAPSMAPFMGGTLSVGTDKTQRATADVNQPLPQLGEHTALRVNLMSHDSMVAGRDVGEYRRNGFAPTLAFGLGTPTRLTLSYFHQSEDDIPDYGIPFLFNRPAPVERHNYYGFRDGNYLRIDANVGTIKAEHDISDVVSLRDQVRYAAYDRAARITEPQIQGSVDLSTPLDQITVKRNQLTTDSTETFLENQTDLTAKFATGPLQHTVVTGIEVGQETSNPVRSTYTVAGTNLLHPDEGQTFAGTGNVSSRVDTTANSVAAYLLDTVKLGRLWELTGGVRWDRFDSHYKQTTPQFLSLARTDKMVSWRGALVFKPVEAGSLYVSYGTSFNPSAEQLSLAANTSQLDPEKSRTYEAGTKWDLMDKRLSLTGAVFRDEKTNARTPDPNDSTLNILDGDQRVDGFELGAAGYLTDHWEVFSGYAYLDSKIVSSGRAFEVGQRIANTPMHTLNVWTTYEFPRGFSVGGGANLVTERIGSTTAPDPVTGQLKKVPGYVVYNAMAKYQVDPRLGFQLNVYNVTDKYYIDTIHPAHLIPGAGRSALLTTNVQF